MSGGSMNYFCYRLEEYAEYFHDKEIKALTKDLADLFHDLEWYESGDYGKDTYERSLAEFKNKWFGETRNERLKEYLNAALDDAKAEINKLI